MAAIVDKNICPHDHLCPLIKICPVGAISQETDGYPVIDEILCIECGACIRKCPMKAMKFKEINVVTSKYNQKMEQMKIAVPTRGGNVDAHFGHCESYTIYTVENNEIITKETLASPQGCGCKSDIANKLQLMGVTLMLAGNLGDGAKIKLNNSNITVVRGCDGLAEDVVKAYLEGRIADSGISCKSHDEHHECHHDNHPTEN
ncbi:MAG: NifB/NifX family molybdenum-iron cluster-binding protein [Parabacteroides sp.]